MTVNLKLFFFILFLITSGEIHCAVIKANQLDILKQRFLQQLSPEQKNMITQRLENCDRDKKCIENILQRGIKYLNSIQKDHRKLEETSEELMQVFFVVLMLYLMFNQPFLTGIMLFLGALGGMFRRVVRRERKLNQNTDQFEMLQMTSDRKLQSQLKKERKNLFYFLKKNPLKFQKANRENLIKTAKKYFAQVYQKNNPKIWKQITSSVDTVMKHQNTIKNYLKTFKGKVQLIIFKIYSKNINQYFK